MSRDGSVTFSDLLGKLATLYVTCDKCGLKRRYAVKRLIDQHGRNGKVTDWLAAVAADCPRKQSIDMSDQCAACCPDLPRVL